ncbi:MAG: hypothetical protein ACREPM_09055 [Gemmatimonadaceae bacterium]
MYHSRRIGLLALAVVFAACSENSTAPNTPASAEATTYAYGGGATADLSAKDTLEFTITIDPNRQTYYDLGSGNSITFPAGSVCDPNKSSYGDGEWDKPCTALRGSLTITVMGWLDSHGHPRVDFSPHVRFVPSWDSRQWVKITFSDLQASLDLSFNILYCPSAHSQCKDETKSDPSLVTYRDPITHKLTRRIKHFSGYNVAAGDDGDASDDSRWSSLSMVSPFRVVAQATPRSSSERLFAATPAARRSKGSPELLHVVHGTRKVSGYILASG